MTDQEKELLLKKQVEDGLGYTNLYLNEDFQQFKEEQFNVPMARIIELVMNDPLTDMQSVRDNILKYQTLRKALVDSFATKIDTADAARELLKNQRIPKAMR